jgi:hypothetical protein
MCPAPVTFCQGKQERPWAVPWLRRLADNLTSFMCRLSRNLGTSTWSPQGL